MAMTLLARLFIMMDVLTKFVTRQERLL